MLLSANSTQKSLLAGLVAFDFRLKHSIHLASEMVDHILFSERFYGAVMVSISTYIYDVSGPGR